MKKPFTPEELWNQGFSQAQMLVYLYISMRDGGNGCWEARSSIADRIGMTRPTLRAAIKTLSQNGWLILEDGKIKTTTTGKPLEKRSPLSGKMRPSSGKKKPSKVEKRSPLTNKGTNKITNKGTDKGQGGSETLFSNSSSKVSSEEEFSSSKLLFSERLPKPGKVANTGLEVATFTLDGKTFSSDTKEDIRGYYMQFIRDHGSQRERWPKISTPTHQ